jgi:PAS domain S-box-containing protein
MLSFKNLPLRRKQTLIMMLTSTMTLLLACMAFLGVEVFSFRGELLDEISTMAQIAGNNCAAALDFNDAKVAEDTLGALRAEPPIANACIYNQRGDVFAVYQRDGKSTAATFPPARPAGHEFQDNQLRLFMPITVQGEKVGTIYVACDLYGIKDRLRHSAMVALAVLGVSLLAAFSLATRLQRIISSPVLQLAQAMRSVAVEKNYSVRAAKQSNDELGQLAEGFNEMLGQIQGRDAALLIARESLEHRVEERTVELAYERELLRELLDYSPDSIYFKDAQSRFLKVGKALAEHCGAKGADELAGRTDFDFYTEARARAAFEDEQKIIRTGQPLIGQVEKEVLKDGRTFWVLTSKMPLRNKDGQIIGTFGISKDITVIKEAEVQLEQLHKQLLETSRRAGMAEIATNVLHNIGNVLNSVNVSASMIVDSVRKSKAANLAKVVDLLREHEHDLAAFITSDARGKKLPGYLGGLSEHLLAEQTAAIRELDLLLKNIGHIKEIVTMQQTYARVSGIKEIINIQELVEDGLRMSAGGLDRHRVEVVREFEEVPLINIDRHKVLQILVNLIRNAKHACQESARADKRLTVRVTNGAGRIKIVVMDNGVGILPENLLRIFNHGFTTRKDGHGFGLHSGALAAKEMGGSLNVQSDGSGQGATLTLELPCTTNGNPNE